jgi:hypothetical protein
MALPGVKTIVKDRFYSISRQDTPVGPRICVIGTRTTADGTGNVADLDVVQVTRNQMLLLLLVKVHNFTKLIRN